MTVTYFDDVRQEWNDLTEIPDGRKPHGHCNQCDRWLPVFPFAKPDTWAGETCQRCNDLKTQANIDRMARELYQHYGYCGACRKSVLLADALQFRCPHCDALYLAGSITSEQGRAMLAALEARRVELKL